MATLTQSQVSTGSKVLRALKSAGISAPVLDWAFAQAAMESGGFVSAISRDDNNFSGILYTGRSNQKNATRSNRKLTDSGMAVAHFATMQDWANDYKRVLSLGANKPILATTKESYFARLKANNYFGAQSTASYMAMCDAWAKKLAPYASPLGDSSILQKIVTAIKQPGVLVALALAGVGAFFGVTR